MMVIKEEEDDPFDFENTFGDFGDGKIKQTKSHQEHMDALIEGFASIGKKWGALDKGEPIEDNSTKMYNEKLVKQVQAGTPIVTSIIPTSEQTEKFCKVLEVLGVTADCGYQFHFFYKPEQFVSMTHNPTGLTPIPLDDFFELDNDDPFDFENTFGNYGDKISIKLENGIGHATFEGNPSKKQIDAANNLAKKAYEQLSSMPPLPEDKGEKEAPTDSEMLNWLQQVMTPDDTFCEVFFAGLREWTGNAASFQIEANPMRFPTLSGKSIRECIVLAMRYGKENNTITSNI